MIFEDKKQIDADLIEADLMPLNRYAESSPDWAETAEIEDFEGTIEWARRRYVLPLMRLAHKEMF